MRYTSVDDREYGPGIKQSYKDKGFDFSIRLLKEARYQPALAIGLFDIGGTSLFGAEYLVASKSIAQFSFSLGLGWGRLGSAGDIRNPMRILSDSFENRVGFAEQGREEGRRLEGGRFNASNWFSGETVGLFANFAWAPAGKKWRLELEYEGNVYDNAIGARPDDEPAARQILSKSRWNGAVKYQLFPGLSVGLAYVRGDTLAGQILFRGRWGRDVGRKDASTYPTWIPDVPAKLRDASFSTGPEAAVSNLQEALWSWQIYPTQMDVRDRTATIWFSSNFSKHPWENSVAVSRLAMSHFGLHMASIESVQTQAGLPVASVTLDRTVVVDHFRDDLPIEEWERRAVTSARATMKASHANYQNFVTFPTWTWGINPALRSNIGGPAGFYQLDVQLKPFLTFQVTERASLTGTLAWGAFGNLDDVESRDSSSLPHVRSDLESYQSQGPDVYLEELELNYVFPLLPDIFGRISAGVFEEMYAGIGFESLWRPLNRRVALGLEVARVQKRDYEQWFGLQNYLATTSLLTLYWRTPWKGVNVELTAGQYLAGDKGATLRLSRVFPNGFEVGGFASKTNVSAVDFGEGSFDKGVFMRIPLASMNRFTGSSGIDFDYRFLTRDGAQRADIGRRLHSIVNTIDWSHTP